MLRITPNRFGEDWELMRVTDDGRDIWTFEPEEDWSGCGAGGAYVWVGSRAGVIRIYHVPTRTRIAEIEIASTSKEWRSISMSRDGHRMFVFEPIDDGQTSTLHLIDVAAGRVVARHAGIPGVFQNYPVQRPDGRLLLSRIKRPGTTGITIVTIDPASGERTVDVLGDGPPTDWVIPSPDGEFLLRSDLTQLPRRTIGGTPKTMLGFGRRGVVGGQLYYGLTWQLWRVDPLRFVRRIVIAWLKPEEMRDALRVRHDDPADEAIERKREAWDAIAAAMAAADAPPEGGPPTRSLYRTPLAADEQSWRQLEDTIGLLRDRASVFQSWQADGNAFWVSTNGFLTCVGLDGTTSPRLYLDRLGIDARTAPRCAFGFEQVSPMAGRKAQVRYVGGTAIFDGAASEEIVRAIPEQVDQWVAAPPPPAPDPRGNVIVIPVAAWTDAAVGAAIDALTAEITPALAARAIDGEIHLWFQMGGTTYTEQSFFDRLPEAFPASAPALRRLVEQLVDATVCSAFLFSNAQEGRGFLSHAVRALGLIDPSALPLVQRYGRVVDREHEHDFAGNTVPALIAAHGWTDAMTEFVFWVLIRNYFNTLHDFSVVWNDWGMRDAVVARDPIALAKRITALNRRALQSSTFAVGPRKGGLAQLASDITKPHEPWLEAFLAEARRAGAD